MLSATLLTRKDKSPSGVTKTGWPSDGMAGAGRRRRRRGAEENRGPTSGHEGREGRDPYTALLSRAYLHTFKEGKGRR